jgi:hypothetical protein
MLFKKRIIQEGTIGPNMQTTNISLARLHTLGEVKRAVSFQLNPLDENKYHHH